MGKNIFVSYKYADDQVQYLPGCWPTTVRDYVDILIDKFNNETDHVYWGEDTDEDLSYLSEDAIYQRLKDKIYYTTVTVVLVSPGMKLSNRLDRSQWIPWEIYYSLREIPRNGRISHRNGVIAVVLPDVNGSYDYMIKEKKCCSKGCTLYSTDKLFNILKYNMFNKKEDKVERCNNGNNIHYGESSYIKMVKWCDFIDNIDYHIGFAEYLKACVKDYQLHISVNAK